VPVRVPLSRPRRLFLTQADRASEFVYLRGRQRQVSFADQGMFRKEGTEVSSLPELAAQFLFAAQPVRVSLVPAARPESVQRVRALATCGHRAPDGARGAYTAPPAFAAAGSSLAGLRRSLGDPPEDPTWIEQREVAHAPGSIRGRTNADPEPIHDARCHHVRMPLVHAVDEQVHLEVAQEVRVVEGLQQERRRPQPARPAGFDIWASVMPGMGVVQAMTR